MKRAACALLLVACHGAPKEQPEPASSALPAASTSVSAAPAKPVVWYEGTWQGSYKAELYRVETAAGGVKEWKKDDGQQASGDGKLSLEAQADGTVTGTASGALGEQAVAGRFEGDRLSLTLTPTQANGFHGVILAAQGGAGVAGSLSASSADSLSVRQASVTMAKANK